jgi:hypothetical protein
LYEYGGTIHHGASAHGKLSPGRREGFAWLARRIITISVFMLIRRQ